MHTYTHTLYNVYSYRGQVLQAAGGEREPAHAVLLQRGGRCLPPGAQGRTYEAANALYAQRGQAKVGYVALLTKTFGF